MLLDQIDSQHTAPGALTWKGGVAMSSSQDPLFTPVPPFFTQLQHDSVLYPTVSKNIKFWHLQEKFVKNSKNFQLCSLNKLLKISSFIDLTLVKNHFFRPPFWRFAPDIPTKNKLEWPPGHTVLEEHWQYLHAGPISKQTPWGVTLLVLTLIIQPPLSCYQHKVP